MGRLVHQETSADVFQYTLAHCYQLLSISNNVTMSIFIRVLLTLTKLLIMQLNVHVV